MLIETLHHNAEAELYLLPHPNPAQLYISNQDSDYALVRLLVPNVLNMAPAIGDIFAAIDKSCALYRILSDSRSSNTQYQDPENNCPSSTKCFSV